MICSVTNSYDFLLMCKSIGPQSVVELLQLRQHLYFYQLVRFPVVKN